MAVKGIAITSVATYSRVDQLYRSRVFSNRWRSVSTSLLSLDYDALTSHYASQIVQLDSIHQAGGMIMRRIALSNDRFPDLLTFSWYVQVRDQGALTSHCYAQLVPLEFIHRPCGKIRQNLDRYCDLA